MNFIVEISQECDVLKKLSGDINQRFFEKILKVILLRYPNFAQVKVFELSILFATKTRMRLLNKKFRGKNKPTNVLSFPDIKIKWQKIVEFPVNVNYMYLGDIALCYDIIYRESKDQMITLIDHFAHLIVHSILHLIGYDHISELDATAMESMEVEILQDLGIKSPY